MAPSRCQSADTRRQTTQIPGYAHGFRQTLDDIRLGREVQQRGDDLKAIVEMVGVASRGELVARVFFQRRVPELWWIPQERGIARLGAGRQPSEWAVTTTFSVTAM